MGNCLSSTNDSIHYEDITNSSLLTDDDGIKDALLLTVSGYSYNHSHDHIVIVDCILSYILFSTPMMVDDTCEYNENTKRFEFKFRDCSEQLIKVNAPEFDIDVKLNQSEYKLNPASFNVYASKSGHIFVTGIMQRDEMEQKQESVWYISGFPADCTEIIIYSKIIQNTRSEITIESPWKTFPKHDYCGGSWRFNTYLVSNTLGLVCCRYDANRKRDENRNNCVHSVANNTQYSFKFMSVFAAESIKIFTEKELIQSGLVEETKDIMEYVVVCGHDKRKNMIKIYALPKGELIKTQRIKHVGGVIAGFNIDVENKYFIFLTKPNQFKMTLIQYDIERCKILKQRRLFNKEVNSQWGIDTVVNIMKDIEGNWILIIRMSDSIVLLESFPKYQDIKIIFDEQLNEKKTIKAVPVCYDMPGIYLYDGEPQDVKQIYAQFVVPMDPQIAI